MFKYIVKRIAISIVILLGVSVIIYTLVRLMPSDYVDQKYSAQLNQGTITQEDLDRFKSLYGLYVPEAYLNMDVDGYGSFERDVKIKDRDYAIGGEETFRQWVVGKYKQGDLRLELKEDRSFSLDKITYVEEEQEIDVPQDDGTFVKEKHVVKKQIKENVEKGTYTASYRAAGKDVVINETMNELQVSRGESYNIKLFTDDGELATSTSYRVAGAGEKLGAILGGYFTWIGNLCRGDLGNSFLYEKPVSQVISENMWISFAIAIVATILQFLIAIPLGVSSATHQYSVRDYAVTVFTMIGLALPTYFFAAIAIKVFAVDLGWLPANGLVDANKTYLPTFGDTMAKIGDMALHLVLPIFVSVILSLGGLMRYTRTNTLEVLNADYIRTARAKGLSEKTVIYKHAFRNTLIPLATLLAGLLPSLFGGMMITEQVFGINGIGNLAYKALKQADIPFVMGYNMFLAILTVTGTLFSDIMYSIVDPRVKLS